MLKKDDNPSNLCLDKKNCYNLEDIFKSCFVDSNSKLVDSLIKRLCNIHDYMKSIFCVGQALEILKPNGLKIEFSSDSNNFSYFIKSENKIILNSNTDEDKIYVSLLELFLYKWLELIDISKKEKENLKDVLDNVLDNSNVFYEELTQKEIKMLEWLDEKLVDLVSSLDSNKNIYKINMDFVDIEVIDLISVYLLWGRNLERLEVVSQILNPLLDYINDTILTKFENYISKNYINIEGLPGYFRIKLNTIKIFQNENISSTEILKLLKEIRLLDIPKQTTKTFEKFKHFLDVSQSYADLDNTFNEFKNEKRLYEYSILQRYDELNYIKEKKKKLIYNIKNNREILDQLMNLEYLISGEVKDLEKSLNIIDEKINLLKKVGV